ncbi:DUF5004 domain-containing protein [Mariniflexile litorale]|uniref:DUF5004 domain-containing protein n=1 Tax=Mariniflexile litorale TaxID=3045158 RepID=A0AAU7EGV6_9FLAO|nr:DUF5004 domain-containing protein [Mariniflexile sp. KMM 9835]MDQ8210703.1 DUF5004 domain-containing protein [Mariniflexile sp. KMM 9835]
MKIIKYSFLISLLVMFTQCSPDNEGTFGDTVDRSEQIMGTWVIESASQVDLDAEKKSFPDFATKIDITNAIAGMPFSDFTLKIDNSSLTTTIGNSPMMYVITEGTGTWAWITSDAINLVNQQLGMNASSGIETQINGENVTFYIRTYSEISGDAPKLSLNYERFDSDNNPVTRYEYILAKQ